MPFGLACGEDDLIPPVLPEPADLYWDLKLNHHAATLSTTAPYDTLRLVATPRNYRGEALAGLPAPQYRSSNIDKVVVTPEGLLIATGHTGGVVTVVATVSANNLRHSDTLRVSVIDDSVPPVLASFSIHPVPPDSAKITVGLDASYSVRLATDTLFPRATSESGARIPAIPYDSGGFLPVDFRSSDTSTAQVDARSGEVVGIRPGAVTMYGSTTAFGVTKVDSLAYRIGWPVSSFVNFEVPFHSPSPVLLSPDRFGVVTPDVRIGAGGVVAWMAEMWRYFPPDADEGLDITFTDATNVLAVDPVKDHVRTMFPNDFFVTNILCAFECDRDGNLVLSGTTPIVGRYFPVPGVYEYHSVRHGVSGRIVVIDER